MRVLMPTIALSVAVMLAAGCVQHREFGPAPGAGTAAFNAETVVVTARPHPCAEARREARRSESPVRVLCRDRAALILHGMGRGARPDYRAGPGR